MPESSTEKLKRVIATAAEGAGQVSVALRKATFAWTAGRADGRPPDGEVPEDLHAYLTKLSDTPAQINDADVDALRGEYSEDQIFEITVLGTLGASVARFDAGMRALKEAQACD